MTQEQTHLMLNADGHMLVDFDKEEVRTRWMVPACLVKDNYKLPLVLRIFHGMFWTLWSEPSLLLSVFAPIAARGVAKQDNLGGSAQGVSRNESRLHKTACVLHGHSCTSQRGLLGVVPIARVLCANWWETVLTELEQLVSASALGAQLFKFAVATTWGQQVEKNIVEGCAQLVGEKIDDAPMSNAFG